MISTRLPKLSEEMRKTDFVDRFLQPLLKEIDSQIIKVYYQADKKGHEVVTIIFKNNYHRDVCVDCDSNKAIVQDVLRVID